MIRGIYTSGLGMTRESKRLDIVSNNLANASTTAFKSDGAVCGTFKKTLNDEVRLHQWFSDHFSACSPDLQ